MFILDFFFNDTATTEIYTLSLHDALPIFDDVFQRQGDHDDRGRADDHVDRHRPAGLAAPFRAAQTADQALDRKSTRLNSSHANISYAVFCLKKKNYQIIIAYILTPVTPLS